MPEHFTFLFRPIFSLVYSNANARKRKIIIEARVWKNDTKGLSLVLERRQYLRPSSLTGHTDVRERVKKKKEEGIDRFTRNPLGSPQIRDNANRGQAFTAAT